MRRADKPKLVIICLIAVFLVMLGIVTICASLCHFLFHSKFFGSHDDAPKLHTPK